jgi:hypothetical protein
MMELVRDPVLNESPCLRLRVGRREWSACRNPWWSQFTTRKEG